MFRIASREARADDPLMAAIARDAATATIAVLTLTFFEWLFFVTKPSFATPLTPVHRILVLFTTAAGLAIPVVITQGLLTLGARARSTSVSRIVRALVPGGVLASLALLLADNFFHTIFFAGLVAAPLSRRLLYLAGFVAVFGWFVRSIARWIGSSDGSWIRRFALLFATAAFLSAAVLYAGRDSGPAYPIVEAGSIRRYNVLLLTSDGITADSTSLYGRAVPTTPFLESFARESLVCRNAFPNASTTLGSLTSMLTGKLPTRTHLTYAPQTLRGRDALEHLPGILRRLGYRTFHVSMRHYADVTDAGLASGFDEANGRTYPGITAPLVDATSTAFLDPVYFGGVIIDRIAVRLRAVLTLHEIPDEYGLISGKVPPQATDAARAAHIIDLIRRNRERPWLIQAHLLDTHCCAFDIEEPYRSKVFVARNASAADLALRRVDDYFRAVVEALRQTGQLDRTIVVLATDHSTLWKTTERIPLLIRFPRTAARGDVTAGVQLIDVPPTILRTLGIEPPRWMEGRNLLHSANLEKVSIFASSRIAKGGDWAQSRRLIVRESTRAPHGVEAVSLVRDGHWAELDLLTNKVSAGVVKGWNGEGSAFDIALAASTLRQHVAETLR